MKKQGKTNTSILWVLILLLFCFGTLLLTLWDTRSARVTRHMVDYSENYGVEGPELITLSPGTSMRMDFRAEYDLLDNMSLRTRQTTAQEGEQGTVTFTLGDAEGNTLQAIEKNAGAFRYEDFVFLPLSQSVKAGETYSITLELLDGQTPIVFEAGRNIWPDRQSMPGQPEGVSLSATYSYLENTWAAWILSGIFHPAACIGILGILLIFFLRRKKHGDTTQRAWLHILLFFLTSAVIYIVGEWYLTGTYLRGLHTLWGLLLVLGVQAILLALTGSTKPGTLGLAILYFLLGTINYYKELFNGQPLMPADIFAAATAAQVVGKYHFTLSHTTLLALLGLVPWVLLALSYNVKLSGWRRNWRTRCALLLSGAVYLFVCLFTPLIPSSMDDGVFLYRASLAKVGYAGDGFLLRFIKEIPNLRVPVPEDYSPEDLEGAILDQIGVSTTETEKAVTVPQNILIIMNESFTDLPSLLNFQVSEPATPFLDSLRDKSIYGHVITPVFGGGTSNSEFEMLTGHSMRDLPAGSYPFSQYLDAEDENGYSIIRQLGQLGYTTLGAHPEKGANWYRDKAYPILGFEEVAFQEAFTLMGEPGDLVNKFVSDRGLYRWMLNRLTMGEEGQRQVLFAVTMQNHGGYSMVYLIGHEPVRALVSPDDDQLNGYLTLIKLSDDALAYLIEQVDALEEPTLVCFFGDHWPGLSNSTYAALGATSLLEDETQARSYEMYQTPFLLYANYGLEARDLGLMSLNYLGPLLMETAGLPLTDYQRLLMALYEELPVYSPSVILDSEGRQLTEQEAREKTPLLNLYNGAQYNALFDTKHRIESLFTLADP